MSSTAFLMKPVISETMKNGILFICAFEPEADLLREAGFRVLTAGIGFLRSALNTQSYLTHSKGEISEIIFTGSAGLYPFSGRPEYREGQFRTVFSHTFTNYDVTLMEGRASSPAVITETVFTEPGPAALYITENHTCENLTVNSVQSITLSEIRPDKEFINKYLKPDCENMEVCGTAYAAKQAGLKFSALLALTNNTGHGGSEDWKKSHRRLSVLLQEELIRLLQ